MSESASARESESESEVVRDVWAACDGKKVTVFWLRHREEWLRREHHACRQTSTHSHRGKRAQPEANGHGKTHRHTDTPRRTPPRPHTHKHKHRQRLAYQHENRLQRQSQHPPRVPGPRHQNLEHLEKRRRRKEKRRENENEPLPVLCRRLCLTVRSPFAQRQRVEERRRRLVRVNASVGAAEQNRSLGDLETQRGGHVNHNMTTCEKNEDA